ncbi:MAG: hypothetical protein J0G35_03825 [Acidobacteriales bacterium]|nr:hypothetical protein [Terriglobales bacterium]
MVAGFGAIRRRSRRGDAAAAAMGVGGNVTSDGAIIGGSAEGGKASSAMGTSTAGNTGTFGLLRECRQPLNPHVNAMHTTAAASLRAM